LSAGFFLFVFGIWLVLGFAVHGNAGGGPHLVGDKRDSSSLPIFIPTDLPPPVSIFTTIISDHFPPPLNEGIPFAERA
jgi:hypothetical protein